MLVYKSALLAFTTLALSGAVQGVAIGQGPNARELSALDSTVALDARAHKPADVSFKRDLVKREPRSSNKASSAGVGAIKSASSEIQAATDALCKYRKTHKKLAKKTNKRWFGGEDALGERSAIEERASKAKNTADLRKTLCTVNKHLLAAASDMRRAQRRNFDDSLQAEKRLVNGVPSIVSNVVAPIVTQALPGVTDLDPVVSAVVSEVLPTVTNLITDAVPAPAITIPAVVSAALDSVLPEVTGIAQSAISAVVPAVTDILPTVAIPDVILPTVSVPDVTLPTVSVPDVVLPTVSVPDVTLPTVSVPDVTLPTVSIPDVILPTVSVPDVTLPTVSVPDVTLPTVSVPDVTLPSVTLPTGVLPISSVTLPSITLPTVGPPVPTQSGATPIGGLAAFLAAIRAFIALLRGLIREIVAIIRDVFFGVAPDTSVLSEIAPGLKAVFAATSEVANQASPAIGNAVAPVLANVQRVFASLGVGF